MARTQRWYLRSSPGNVRPAEEPEEVWSRKLADFEKSLGIVFKDKSQLKLALTHSSAVSGPGRRTKGGDNERLEFLGDAVLELVISHLLYIRKKDCDEGQMTQMRSQLVNTTALASQARSLDVPQFIRLGKGESASGGAFKSSINANTFEALLGAIFLDQGWEVASKFVWDLFIDQIDSFQASDETKDPKSLLQEISLSKFGSLPRYVMVGQRGREHDKVFQVKLLVNNEVLSIGRGKSKKAAELEAAALALRDFQGRT